MKTNAMCSATLVPDQGRLCLCPDYFRSAHHLRAEGVTHTLVLERARGEALRIPLVVRPIEGTRYWDAVSPYGMPGGSPEGLSLVPKDAVDWSDTPLVSIFVRERIGGPHCFTGATARCEVCLVDPTLPVRYHETHARHIRRNQRLGFVSRCVHAPEAPEAEREGLKALYRETMVRDRAQARYFFSDAWFDEVFASPAAWLLSTRAPDGELASAALAVRSDGLLHYFIGGTASALLAHSPAKNTIDAMYQLAERFGLVLHLGGGLHPGDGLEKFKRGFANATSWFHTHELVCDPVAYASLCRDVRSTEQFPAYRALRALPQETYGGVQV